MTKRPSEEKFKEKYSEVDGNVPALADIYDCNIGSIYNWISLYMKGVKADVTEEQQLSFKEYVDAYKVTMTKARPNSVGVSIDDSALIVCLSDTHLGSVYTDIEMLERDTKIIKETDNVFAIFVGDIVDWTPSGHKDLSYEQVFPQAAHSKQMAEKWVKEIAHKMLMIVTGCHDKWEYNETGEYFLERVSKDTVTGAFCPDSALLKLNVGEIMYKIFMTHKISGGVQNPSHGLFRRARENLDFDIGVAAHKHSPGIASQMIRDKPVTAINCGTYKRVDGFAKVLAITQQPMSIPGFYVDSKTRTIIPFLDWKDGLALLKNQ